jgi:hypothetical protein
MSVRKGEWILTRETFAKLLRWLDSDSEEAARKYEEIRQRLIKIFIYRGCTTAEELADETIDRVSRKIDDLTANFVGDKRLYFYGVAQNIYREYLREQSRPTPTLLTQNATDDEEYRSQCLENCLQELPAEDHQLILEYYREEKQSRIKHRKLLTQQMRPNTLRKKTQRIRERLKRCIEECLKKET